MATSLHRGRGAKPGFRAPLDVTLIRVIPFVHFRLPARQPAIFRWTAGLLIVLTSLFVGTSCDRSPEPAWPEAVTRVEAGTSPIVLITIEALPWSALELGRTPFLGELASRGRAFPAIAASSALIPSLIALHTGSSPDLQDPLGDAASSLPRDVTTLAELLSDRGWQTSAFVSGPEIVVGDGLEQGFSTFEGRARWARAVAALESADERSFFWIHLSRLRPPWRGLSERTDAAAPLTNEDIERADRDPEIRAEALRLYQIALQAMDEQVGAILETLEDRDARSGQTSRVLLVGAQGISLPAWTAPGRNGRLGSGQDLARHQIEVPVITNLDIHWSSESEPNRLPVASLMNILLGLAGIEPGPGLVPLDDQEVWSRLVLTGATYEESRFDRATSKRRWSRHDPSPGASFDRLEMWQDKATVELDLGSDRSPVERDSVEKSMTAAPAPGLHALPEDTTIRELRRSESFEYSNDHRGSR